MPFPDWSVPFDFLAFDSALYAIGKTLLIFGFPPE